MVNEAEKKIKTSNIDGLVKGFQGRQKQLSNFLRVYQYSAFFFYSMLDVGRSMLDVHP
jgi:hypothetical protein